MDEALELFFRDPKLTELCDVLRTGEDILDVISLSENQHSDLLAWLLDPREGHGQGDMVIRDLLLGAQETAENAWPWLDGRSTTAKFFEDWPPSRIRTANFGSVFIARELGMSAADRVDLFVIDPVNNFVLLIENKSQATHTSEQLERYRSSWNNLVARTPHLKDYRNVFIALDREYDAEGFGRRPYQGFWLYLGYGWLKGAANRALLQFERGNEAARMVVSYCNRQTDWQSPAFTKALTIVTALQEEHGASIRHLLDMSAGRIERYWLESRCSAEIMFMLQNKSILSLLRETRGMAAVKEILVARVDAVQRDKIRVGRTNLWLCPSGAARFIADDCWPVFLEIKCVDAGRSKYSAALVFETEYIALATEIELRERLQRFDEKFSTHSHCGRRKVILDTELSIAELVAKVASVSEQLRDALHA
ncbi:PD-(D/E)XK nuclease family protein [Pseudomonas sp. BW13M1]|uniref:PD-(D/E)XK nuclease family protein n=1 Tax=Pseudomonas peradeniyensis TaxID=2745488 RepID=A0A923JZZ9_9PSED|nr:PD-(D/E)XK nuclease family protein [Pseudomonas peradeniyensis]MBV4507520.1 PD-(D/E)XK nuclease family protein [Pseudomonas peradeniyensis]